MTILILTHVFPPEIGGAGAVPDALATRGAPHITVAAPRFQSGSAPVRDWPLFDRRFRFPVLRVPAFATALPRWLPARLRGPAQFAYNLMITRPRAAAALLRHFAQAPADVICINTLIPCYWIPAVLRRRYPRLPVILYLHGEEVSEGPRPTRLYQMARRTMREADAVVTVSSFTRDKAIGYGVAPERITVIHNGVDAERFSPGAKDPALVDRFGLAGRRVLLCLARLDERKGQDMLLRAMPEILAAVPETVLLLVGGGTDEPRLRALAATLGLGDRVIFVGMAAEEEMVRFYRTADVYVMPNRTTASGDTEGFGLTFLEAGACGRPVIGGRAGGVPDAVVDGVTGLLIDATSHPAVAEACIRLLADSALAETLGRNGRAHSLENTWSRQTQRFLALCEELRARSVQQPSVPGSRG